MVYSFAMTIRFRYSPLCLPAFVCLILCISTAQAQNPTAAKPTVAEALAFIDNAEKELNAIQVDVARAQWVEETYITDDTVALVAEAEDRLVARQTELIGEGQRFKGLALPPDAVRKLTLLKLSIGLPAPSDPALRAETTQKAAELDAAYGRGRYCPEADKEHCLGIDELGVKMAQIRDPKELAELWAGWHAVGVPMRGNYARLAELSNQGARELGFADTGALWRSQYDMTPEEFQAEIERLWTQVEPLYRELHTYVRHRLIEKYGDAARRPDGMIPAHLLGNMWAQEWGNIYDVVAPPSGPLPYDLGAILKARHTDAPQLVRYGEGFYKSLGFKALPDTFWKRSMLAHPRDRDVVCHPSAWDVDNVLDVRIKACFQPTADDFVTVHHELGHNYYQMAYRNQPYFFRDGANDGFHEAIGDSIALNVTPDYLKKLGLIDEVPPPSADIPLLLRTALDKIAFLPFGLLIDKWRWQVYSGQVTPEHYESAWWALREKYQGVAPPVARSEADFDPGAKYHIPGNVPYMRYFLARVYQFQFYRAMCQAAGYKGPLNRCSVYGSKEAGARLNAMLELGRSKPWPEALKAMTGSDRADASAIVEYFQPLMDWLKEQNKGEKEGWTLSADPLR
ncbi:MAG: M2 family metallopeptidase [Terracidiphilus sp.]|jgi:peptidyl-dipeptidase A